MIDKRPVQGDLSGFVDWFLDTSQGPNPPTLHIDPDEVVSSVLDSQGNPFVIQKPKHPVGFAL